MELYQKRRIQKPGTSPEQTTKSMLKMLEMLVDNGLKCLETMYGSYSPEQIKRQKEYAKRFGLWETIGTDYHGHFMPGRTIGMPGMTYEEFKRFKAFCINE
jgi:hypothetical protein